MPASATRSAWPSAPRRFCRPTARVARDESRGEPAFVFELGGRAFGFVLEGLGTKSVIARQVHDELGYNGFAQVAYDTVAAIVNDLICVGALPMVVNAYFATGASEWYARRDRHEALLTGWREACVDAGATWGGGESPSLPGLVAGEDIELAGARSAPFPSTGRPVLGDDLEPGDDIVFVASSGLHANGSSLARKVASELPRRLWHRAAQRPRLRRGAAGSQPHLRAARPGAPAEPGGDPLPQPYHRARNAQADATAAGARL